MTFDGEQQLADLAAELRPALMRLNRRIRMEGRVGPLTLTQLSALSTVDLFGPLTAGDLAARERVQPPSMTKVIVLLEDAGFVRRDENPDDKRQAIICITTSGTALLETARQVGDAWLSDQLGRLSEDEREQLRALRPILDKLVAD